MTRRLIVAFLAIVIGVLVVLVVPLGITFADAEEGQLLAGIERDAQSIAGSVEGTDGRMSPSDQKALVEHYAEQIGGRAIIINAEGVCTADSAEPPGENYANRPEVSSALSGAAANGRRLSRTTGGELLFAAVPIDGDSGVIGVVRVTFPRSSLDDRIRSNWVRLASLSVLVIFAATMLALSLAKWVMRPVAALEQAANATTGGDLSARAPEDSGPGELRALARAYNDMASRQEELIESQRQFVADASHQLRTPLTALSLRVESLFERLVPEPADGAPDPTGTEADLAAAEAEVQRLSRLVDELLALSRAEGGEVDRVEVDGVALLQGRIDLWGPVAESDGVELRLDTVEAAGILAVPGALEQVVDNLVANALRASEPGSTLVLGLRAAEHGWELTVVDHGPGLSDEQKGLAVRRFWRADPTDRQSSGLGLAIVGGLVAQSGGHLELRDTPGGGLTVAVWWAAAS